MTSNNNSRCYNTKCPKYNKGKRCGGCYYKTGHDDSLNEDIFMDQFLMEEF